MPSTIETHLLKVTGVKPEKGETRGEFLTRIWNAAHALDEENWDKLSAPAATWVNEVTNEYRAWQAKKPNGEFVPDELPGVEAAKPLRETLEVADVEEPQDEPQDEPQEEPREAPKAKPKAKAGPKPAPERELEDEEEPAEEPAEEESEEGEEAPEEVLETKPAKPVAAKPEPKKPTPKKPEPKPEPKPVAKKPQPEPERPATNVQGMVRIKMIENPGIETAVLQQEIEAAFDTKVSTETVRASRSWFKAALRDLQQAGCLSKNFQAKLAQAGALRKAEGKG